MLKNQCIVMAIFQHFSFGPPLETMKKELSKEASQNKKEAYAENLSCLSHWEPRNLPRPPSSGQDDQTLLMCMCHTNQNFKLSELISLLFVFPTINVSRIPNLSCLPSKSSWQLAAELFYKYDQHDTWLGLLQAYLKPNYFKKQHSSSSFLLT